MDNKERANFRATKEWKDFREERRRLNKVDYLTQKRLTKGFNLHHMDLDYDHYTDLSNPENFLTLNKKSHDCIHFLYNYYAKDPSIIDRLKECLDKMKQLNK